MASNTVISPCFASWYASLPKEIGRVFDKAASDRRHLIRFFWNVAPKIHAVIKDANDLYHLRLSHAIHDEMPTAAALARDVERSHIWEDFIARGATHYVGARFKRSVNWTLRQRRYRPSVGRDRR